MKGPPSPPPPGFEARFEAISRYLYRPRSNFADFLRSRSPAKRFRKVLLCRWPPHRRHYFPSMHCSSASSKPLEKRSSIGLKPEDAPPPPPGKRAQSMARWRFPCRKPRERVGAGGGVLAAGRFDAVGRDGDGSVAAGMTGEEEPVGTEAALGRVVDEEADEPVVNALAAAAEATEEPGVGEEGKEAAAAVEPAEVEVEFEVDAGAGAGEGSGAGSGGGTGTMAVSIDGSGSTTTGAGVASEVEEEVEEPESDPVGAAEVFPGRCVIAIAIGRRSRSGGRSRGKRRHRNGGGQKGGGERVASREGGFGRRRGPRPQRCFRHRRWRNRWQRRRHPNRLPMSTSSSRWPRCRRRHSRPPGRREPARERRRGAAGSPCPPSS